MARTSARIAARLAVTRASRAVMSVPSDGLFGPAPLGGEGRRAVEGPYLVAMNESRYRKPVLLVAVPMTPSRTVSTDWLAALTLVRDWATTPLTASVSVRPVPADQSSRRVVAPVLFTVTAFDVRFVVPLRTINRT